MNTLDDICACTIWTIALLSIQAAVLPLMGEGTEEHDDGPVYLLDYADGADDVTWDTIDTATDEADGAPVVFPADETIILSGGIHSFDTPLHWKTRDGGDCTLKLDPEEEFHGNRWVQFNGSTVIEGLHFDGSNNGHEAIRLNVEDPDGTAKLRDGSVHHWWQGEEEDGSQATGQAIGIRSTTRYERLEIEHFDVHHISGAGPVGTPRPQARGILFSGSESPRQVAIDTCEIYRVWAGETAGTDGWGAGRTDCDGIVWNSGDRESRIDIRNCTFRANAKRPIKVNTGAKNAYISNCTFTEERLPDGGYTRYRNLAYQGASGAVRHCTWNFPHKNAWPSQAILLWNTNGYEESETEGVSFRDGTVRLERDDPISNSVFNIIHHANVSFHPDRRLTISGWKIAVSGGVRELINLRGTGRNTVTKSKKFGTRVDMENMTISKINKTTWRFVDRRPDETKARPYVGVRISDVDISDGNTDPAAHRGDPFVFHHF